MTDDAAAKREDPSGNAASEDIENRNPGALLASASTKRRFVSPRMVGAGAKGAQPLATKAQHAQLTVAKKAQPSAAKPAAALAGVSAAEASSDQPPQYFTVLYAKKSNKVGDPACCLTALQDRAPQRIAFSSYRSTYVAILICRNVKTSHLQTVSCVARVHVVKCGMHCNAKH